MTEAERYVSFPLGPGPLLETGDELLCSHPGYLAKGNILRDILRADELVWIGGYGRPRDMSLGIVGSLACIPG